MLEGRRGDLESQVPIMNKEQPAATFTTISAQESNGASIIESLSESHHVSTTDHQLSYGLVESKPGIDVLSNNKQSEYPTSCTQASSDDNNNSNSILERVSHQINSFEYSQESSSSYSPLSWQLSRVYQNNSDNLLKVDELSSSIVDENVNFKYLNQNENFGEMIASSKVPTTKINSIATSKDITLSSTSSSSMIDGQTVTVSSPVIVNSVSIQRTAADGDCVFSDQQCEYEQASESRINLESQAINDDSNSSDNIVRNVSYENTPSTKRQTNSLFTQFQSSVDDGTKQSQELAPNQYENIQSEHAISQSTDSRMVIQDIISNASSDDVLCEKGALLSIPDDGCEEYIQDVHAASNPQIIASNSEACDKNTSALLIKNKLILSNAEASVSLSNNPQSDGITVSPSQYTVSSKHQLMNLEPPPIDSIINADPNISSISTSSQSLQVYPPELLTADLSNVQSDKSFTDVQLNVIKTEPQFSPEPSINSSITLKTEESSVPAIAIKQEVPSMDPDSIECKTEPNDDDCYSINKNLTLPSVATLPPFSSTSHDLAIAHANADQIHYIQQPIEAGHEFSSPEEAARVPLILSNSNQTTVLPSIFKMTNSSNATTLTPLTQASIPQEERQGIEPSVVAPVLSMSSGPFATFGGAANTDQPYLLIPVSANQQILAFASSLASSPNFTTPISSTITFNTQSNVVMNPTSTWPAVTTCSSLPAQSSNKTELASSTTKPTSSKNHVCNLCGKNFSSRAVHNLHMRSHSGEKPYPCMVCGRHFSQKTSLTRHMRSHTGERPFPCALCGKSFSDKERVKIHMRSHTGEKPFPCSVCGKHFSQKSTVKRHMSVHTGERPFKCETCGKGFANRGNLNSHIRTHSSTH